MPSAVIRTFRYNPDDKLLVVEFVSGRRYAYFDVPRNVYDLMRGATSRGAYFNSQVRDNYQYAELSSSGVAPPK
jgi:hypothetical protein